MKLENLALACSAGLLCWFYASAYEFRNAAALMNDEWEYQSLAVNVAHGHGFVFGMKEPYESYRFELHGGDLREKFVAMEPTPYFYRAPGYPWAVGMFYRYISDSPLAIKRLQLMAIVLSGLVYVVIGRKTWGRMGFWTAFALWPAYLPWVTEHAHNIIPESFQILLIPLVILACMRAESTQNSWGHGALGVFIGLSVLYRPTVIFFPAIYYGLRLMEGRTALKPVLAGAAACALVLAAWSTYASIHCGKPVLITTQTGSQIYTYNNPHTTETGTWWNRTDPADRQPRTESQYLAEAAAHYLKRPGNLVRAVSQKSIRWMVANPLLVAMGLLSSLPYLLFRRWEGGLGMVVRCVGLQAILIAVAGLAFGIWEVSHLLYDFRLVVLLVPLMAWALVCMHRDGILPRLPVSVLSFLINFALVVLVFGVTASQRFPERLTRPAYGLFLLVLSATLAGMVLAILRRNGAGNIVAGAAPADQAEPAPRT